MYQYGSNSRQRTRTRDRTCIKPQDRTREESLLGLQDGRHGVTHVCNTGGVGTAVGGLGLHRVETGTCETVYDVVNHGQHGQLSSFLISS